MPFFGFKTSQQPSVTSEPKTWPRLMSSSCYRQLRQHNPAQKMARFTVDGYIFRVCSKCATSTWAGWDTFAQLTKFRICWRRTQYFDLSGNRFWVEVSHCSLKLNCILPLLYHGQAVFLNERVMSIPYDHYCFHPQENAIIEVRAPLNLAQDYTLNRPAPEWIIKEIQYYCHEVLERWLA